jgi:hypothetical protein
MSHTRHANNGLGSISMIDRHRARVFNGTAFCRRHADYPPIMGTPAMQRRIEARAKCKDCRRTMLRIKAIRKHLGLEAQS